jgi:hypothetical protein
VNEIKETEMNRSIISLSVTLIGCLLMISGCVSSSKPSGFLTSYKDFRPGPEGGVDKYWVGPEIKSATDFNEKITSYSKVIIDPIWVSLGNREPYDGVDPEELHDLVNAFRQELVLNLKSRYPLVNTAGPGVLRLSIGLTGVESPSRILATTSTFLPVGLGISTISRIVTGEHTNVGSATMELVASDSLSGKTIFAALDRRAGSKDLKKLLDPLSDARQAFSWWAKRLRTTLESGYRKVD